MEKALNKQQTRHLSDDIFRQYDIRGKVGSELLIKEVYDLIRAMVCFFKERNPQVSRIVVGADGRVHSPAIKEEVCRALQDSGIDVIVIGVCPTPVLYFALYMLPVEAGLMITASHNTKEYNGIKIVLDKKSIWGEDIQVVKNYYTARKYFENDKGSYVEHDLIDTYISWLADHFSHLQNMSLSAVVDCGNGAAGTVLPKLCKVMQWKNVELLYPEVDGTYPNHTADPTSEENMQDVKRMLQMTDIQVGIGLDGDGDRMGAVTKSGDLILGDKLLAVFANDIRKDSPSAIIIHDLKCSSGLRELLQEWGMQSYASPTGHAWVKQYMKKYHATLGGELSCHLFFHDRYFGFDDGIYAMMRLFEVITKTGKSLDELVASFPKKISSPEIRFECPEDQKEKIILHVKEHFEKQGVELLTIDGVYVTFHNGWGIIRASNTQPALSIRFEADTQDNFKIIKEELIRSLEAFYNRPFLKKALSQ